MTVHNDCENSTTASGGWFLAALLIFILVGTVDWSLAISSSTAVGTIGYITSWIAFVALWAVGASLWSLLAGILFWAATGDASTTPILSRLLEGWRRWCRERHRQADASRLATTFAALITAPIFVAASLSIMAFLIEDRNVPVLIAAAALVSQAALGVGLFFLALTIRRILTVVFNGLRRRRWLGFLNTPTVVVASVGIALICVVATIILNIETFNAVEGPSVALVVVAIVLHPIATYLFDTTFSLPVFVRRGLWTTPLIALIVVGVVSQNSQARLLLVLHGETANFAFNTLHRHADLDRFFHRSDCPPLGPDGLPVDGMTSEEYHADCMDPAFDRPTSRQEIPEFERPPFDKRPSFVFVTWDSVRVDRLGFMGHDRDTTPNLDAFAERSLVFDRAFAADSGTGPSFWSLMAGKTPFQVNLLHGNRFPPPIDPDEQMLGELLEDAGYRNEGVMCGTLFARPDWGIKWGFDSFDNVCGRNQSKLAPLVTEASTIALQRLTGSDEPFFLWVHYFDPHQPYTNHPEIGYGKSRLDRYDEELTYTDQYFQKLVDVIDAVQDKSSRPIYTIMSSDHGENFNEHGTDPHARNLYRIVTQVPKIVHGPHIEPGRVDVPVALNDVYPTVLDLAGIEIPTDSTMVSQVPVLFGAEPDTGRMVFQENSWSRPRRHTRAVIYDRYHYIMDLTTNSEEFYDYVDDPQEKYNLSGTRLPEEQIMRQALVRFLETSTIPEGLED